jgi:23S rRNA pseudouridine955/2504/2580 synthase/23S rRNA pseudouridine1911/1915/1917 synthase
MPEGVEPPVATDFRIVYEDHDLLVVDKPASLPCHPGGRYFRHTLWSLLRERSGLASPLFVNRLDRETSGLVVVARHQEAARHCGRQWLAHRVEKRYLVMVEGMFLLPEMEASGSLAPDPGSAIRKKVRFFPGSAASPANSRHCCTQLRRLASGNGLTLLEALPVTGRCHQIRATLCSLGFPVVGDKIYGVDERLFLRFLEDRLSAEDRLRLRLPRQALHGAGLSFQHPADNRLLHFVSPLPREMLDLLG